jgi:hypothetical protein
VEAITLDSICLQDIQIWPAPSKLAGGKTCGHRLSLF